MKCFFKKYVATNHKVYQNKSGMALKNQNNKIFKGTLPIRKPYLNRKQKKLNKLPQIPRTNFLSKETLLSLT